MAKRVNPHDVAAAFASEASLAPVRLSLEQLVQNYVTARRRDYVSQAWAAFGNGDYREAQRRFMLADSASAESPASRPAIKLALVYAGIAAKQYWQASQALSWLLRDDPRTGESRDAQVFNEFRDIRLLYPSHRRQDYADHLRAIENLAAQSPDSPALRALWTMATWGGGDRANAIFQAGRIKADPEKGGRFLRLHECLRKAEQPSPRKTGDDLLDLILPELLKATSEGPAID